MPEIYDKPKSMCYCGHTGDGPGSDHAGISGHGYCKAILPRDAFGVYRICGCGQFTWRDWLPEFVEYLKPDQLTIPL